MFDDSMQSVAAAGGWRLPATCLFLMVTTVCNAQDPGPNVQLQNWVNTRISTGDNLAVVAVTIDGDDVAHFAAGSVAPGGAEPDQQTQFQIGSITKVFTDLLLAEMVAKGEVDYDTRIGSLLGAGVTPANPDVATITLEQLATHTSGLPRLPANLAPIDQLDPYKGYDEASLLEGLATTRDKQPLGHHYAYSNFAAGLLGYLLGKRHGGGYRQAVVDEVIVPLHLRQTGFQGLDDRAEGFRNGEVVPAWTLEEALAGAGGLWGSAADFELLGKIMLGQAESGLHHDLDADLDKVAAATGGFDVSRAWHIAYANRRPIYWHNGGTGGYWSFFGFRPDAAKAVAVSGSSSSAEPGGTSSRIACWTGGTRSANPLRSTHSSCAR